MDFCFSVARLWLMLARISRRVRMICWRSSTCCVAVVSAQAGWGLGQDETVRGWFGVWRVSTPRVG